MDAQGSVPECNDLGLGGCLCGGPEIRSRLQIVKRLTTRRHFLSGALVLPGALSMLPLLAPDGISCSSPFGGIRQPMRPTAPRFASLPGSRGNRLRQAGPVTDPRQCLERLAA